MAQTSHDTDMENPKRDNGLPKLLPTQTIKWQPGHWRTQQWNKFHPVHRWSQEPIFESTARSWIGISWWSQLLISLLWGRQICWPGFKGNSRREAYFIIKARVSPSQSYSKPDLTGVREGDLTLGFGSGWVVPSWFLVAIRAVNQPCAQTWNPDGANAHKKWTWRIDVHFRTI